LTKPEFENIDKYFRHTKNLKFESGLDETYIR